MQAQWKLIVNEKTHQLKTQTDAKILRIRILFLEKPRSAQFVQLTNETMPSNLKELFGDIETLECVIESCHNITVDKELKKIKMEIEYMLAMGRNMKKQFFIDLESTELLPNEEEDITGWTTKQIATLKEEIVSLKSEMQQIQKNHQKSQSELQKKLKQEFNLIFKDFRREYERRREKDKEEIQKMNKKMKEISEKVVKGKKQMDCNLKDLEASMNQNMSDLSEENTKIIKRVDQISAAIQSFKISLKQKQKINRMDNKTFQKTEELQEEKEIQELSSPQKKVKTNIIEQPKGLLPGLSLFGLHFGKNQQQQQSQQIYPKSLINAYRFSHRKMQISDSQHSQPSQQQEQQQEQQQVQQSESERIQSGLSDELIYESREKYEAAQRNRRYRKKQALYKNLKFKELIRNQKIEQNEKKIKLRSQNYLRQRYFYPFVIHPNQSRDIEITILKGEGQISFGVLGFSRLIESLLHNKFSNKEVFYAGNGTVMEGKKMVTFTGKSLKRWDRVKMHVDFKNLKISWWTNLFEYGSYTLKNVGKVQHLIPFIQLPTMEDEIQLV